jgi:hypothetical protein
MQLVFHVQQLVALALHHARDRNAGRTRHHLGDFLGADFGAQQLGLVGASACRFGLLELASSCGSGRTAVPTPCQLLSRVACSICCLMLDLFLDVRLPCTTASRPSDFLESSARAAARFPRRSVPGGASLVLFLLDGFRSIFSWIRRRSSLSITSGLESISILILAAASSIRSMALSGRKRSVM